MESGYGKHTSGRFNYFGIKGPGTSVWTTEYKNGKRERVKATFRDYNSLQDGIADHTRTVLGHNYPGYASAKTYKDAVSALVRGGYATDPNYAAELLSIIQSHSRR